MADLYADVDTALSEVPVNLLPLTDSTDFKTIEDAIAYNAAGMALYWHFFTTAGAYTVTAVTPTTAGTYDWTDQGASGVYTIEIPASGGASINNDTEGFGWFTGSATGVLPWRGPVICFRASGLNDKMIDDAYSTTRGLAGTALPAAAADAAGGLPISDAGGLDLDAQVVTKINDILTDTGTTLQGELDGIQADTEDIQARLPAALTADGNIKADTLRVSGTTQTARDIGADTTAIVADTNELQTDWANGGRLDLILDARASQTSVDTIDTEVGVIDGIVDTILVDTNELQTDWVNGGRLDLILDARASQTSVDDLPTNAELATALAAADDAVLAAIAALNNLSSAQAQTAAAAALTAYDPPTKAETDAAALAAFTTQMTESYAANGVAPTPAQALFAIHQYLMQFAITSTSYAVKKLDNSTAAFTVTLNDATTPTGAART